MIRRATCAIITLCVASCCPSLAAQDERFVEFPELPAKTRIYDLRTVQIIQPGRFTVRSTSIDDADVIKFKLNVLGTLRIYCKGPDGNYPPPTNLFTLGVPDLPTKNIEVKSSQSQTAGMLRPFKYATWYYPYKRLAAEDRGDFTQDDMAFFCKNGIQGIDEEELYLKQRASITNGTQNKELLDCKRGLRGEFDTLDEEAAGPDPFSPSDPAKVRVDVVRPGSYVDLWYRGICLRVMHEKPFSSE